MNEHECIIGLYYETEGDSLVALSDLKRKVSDNEDLKKIAWLDPVYAQIYHRMRHYKLSDYCDRRKSVNMCRFEYCPFCGKKIDWKGMKKENGKDSDKKEY